MPQCVSDNQPNSSVLLVAAGHLTSAELKKIHKNKNKLGGG
jgi:hypothetical protein